MNRRNFFTSLLAGVGALAMRPERLLAAPQPMVTTLTAWAGDRLTVGDIITLPSVMLLNPPKEYRIMRVVESQNRYDLVPVENWLENVEFKAFIES